MELAVVVRGQKTPAGGISVYTAANERYFITPKMAEALGDIKYPQYAIVNKVLRSFSNGSTEERPEVMGLFATKEQCIDAYNGSELLKLDAVVDLTVKRKAAFDKAGVTAFAELAAM